MLLRYKQNTGGKITILELTVYKQWILVYIW